MPSGSVRAIISPAASHTAWKRSLSRSGTSAYISYFVFFKLPPYYRVPLPHLVLGSVTPAPRRPAGPPALWRLSWGRRLAHRRRHLRSVSPGPEELLEHE